jgi:hypothetical protein
MSISGCLSKFLFESHRRTVEDPHIHLGLDQTRGNLVDTFQGEEVNFKASNGDIVNGMHFKGNMDAAIIFLHGNACFYETSFQKPLLWVQSIFEKTGGKKPHLVIFNPRGTGKSSGITETVKVAEDFRVIFHYLTGSYKVSLSKVAISGHSMGGYFGAFGAALIQAQFPKHTIHFLSDRSLSSLEDRMTLKLKSENYSYVSSLAIKGAFSIYGCKKSPIAAMKTLKGRVCIIFHKGDSVIPYEQSTHFAAEKEAFPRPYTAIELFEKSGEKPSSAHAHNREFSDEENERVVVELMKMLGLASKA